MFPLININKCYCVIITSLYIIGLFLAYFSNKLFFNLKPLKPNYMGDHDCKITLISLLKFSNPPKNLLF